jgi:hypothetical protein
MPSTSVGVAVTATKLLPLLSRTFLNDCKSVPDGGMISHDFLILDKAFTARRRRGGE